MQKDYSDSIPDYLRYSTWKSDAKFSERIKAVAVIQGNSIEVHVAPTKEPQPATRSNLIDAKESEEENKNLNDKLAT